MKHREKGTQSEHVTLIPCKIGKALVVICKLCVFIMRSHLSIYNVFTINTLNVYLVGTSQGSCKVKGISKDSFILTIKIRTSYLHDSLGFS